ncbi:ribosomal protein S6 kinase delta-1 isoform X2 [Chelonus insularis]|nr:ribosomal protein S6 kinase delta-1 isoform X2 [Chelonus insularis]
MTSCKDKWVRRFFITETSLHKTGFTIYKVTSLIFLKNSPDTASSVSVWKRYSDFKNLYKSLYAVYKNSSIKEPFPKFAKSKYFGRFDKKVVEERRECANKFLEFIAKYSILYTHDIFIKFFETSLDSQKADSQSVSPDLFDEDPDHNVSDIVNVNDLSISNGELDQIEVCSQSDDNSIVVTSADNSSDNNIKFNTSIISYGLNNILEEYHGNIKKQENSLAPSNSQVLNMTLKDFNHYVIIAAAHINAGHKHEHLEEYKEAYVQYKLGIMQLQHCVNSDPDLNRQKRVLDNVSKYVKKIDEIYKKYLNSDVSMFMKPPIELKKYKILKIMGSTTILVRDTEENVERIVKTVAKPAGCIKGVNNYILYPKVPMMVQLHAFIETETTIFFILEYIKGQKLWDIITSDGTDKLDHDTPKNESLETTPNKLEEHFEQEESSNGVHNGQHDHDLSINQLLDKAKKLLISVDVTLKQSDSMTNKLNELGNTSKSYDQKSDSHSTKNSELSDLLLAHGLADNSSVQKMGISKDLETFDSSQALTFDDIVNYIDDQDVNTSEIKNNYIFDDEEYWSIPENMIRRWAIQLLQILEALHEQNIVLMNLRPDNLLIDQDNCVRLNCIIPQQGYEFIDCHIPYTAPELYMYISPISVDPAADVWSYGIILYELLTGIKFSEEDSYIIYSQSVISIPCRVSENARSLLTDILKLNPEERPSIAEIKKHPFFESPD